MVEWLKALRLPVCLLSGLLAIAGFRLGGIEINFWAVLAVVFGACSTMLQNDWRDRYHDKLKGKTLALRQSKKFLVCLFVFWLFTAALTLFVTLENFSVGLILWFMIIVGLVYSEIRLWPAASLVTVAVTAGSPALLSLAAGANNNHCPWMLFLSTLLIILGRETLKDVEDAAIDHGYKWTIPQQISIKASINLATIFILLGIGVSMLISCLVLPGALLAIIGLIFFKSEKRISVAKKILDIGVALAIIILIFTN